ncbi:unnamed protein product [Schistocephalus solidus]|uniref:Uncharacterized protein n=1 Tax=Schistocephalus solidus TaxID=70667 RepID=A0A183TQ59_SCHSO|nr:unnamed protein product [Schistocephalus solidus]
MLFTDIPCELALLDSFGPNAMITHQLYLLSPKMPLTSFYSNLPGVHVGVSHHPINSTTTSATAATMTTIVASTVTTSEITTNTLPLTTTTTTESATTKLSCVTSRSLGGWQIT